MYLAKYLTFLAIVATSVLAAPAAEAEAEANKKPKKPKQPKQPKQTNYCGNGVTPWCCISDGKGSYTDCVVMGTFGSSMIIKHNCATYHTYCTQ